MMPGTIPAAIALVGVLILVGSGVYRRGLGARRVWRLALLWLVIIALLWGAAELGLATRQHGLSFT